MAIAGEMMAQLLVLLGCLALGAWIVRGWFIDLRRK